MKLDTELLHHHIKRRLKLEAKPQRMLVEELNISRSTFWRLTQDKELHVSTLLKIVEWLGEDVNKYIIKKRTYGSN